MDLARPSLPGAVQRLLLSIPGTSRERAADLLQGMPGRGGYVPRLRTWLEQCGAAFPEPVAAEDLDGLSELGVDVLLRGVHSGIRIGFQVKSDNDLADKTFTPSLKAQLLEAQSYGIDLMVVVFSCSPTKKNLTKITPWQSFALRLPNQSVLCLSPERAAGLLEIFDRPLELSDLSQGCWVDFFHAAGQLPLAKEYLETWPALSPDQRFLPPENLPEIRSALEKHRLVFLIGAPATGKTYTAIQILWEAHQAGRPVRWVTANDVTPTEGFIPQTHLGSREKLEFRRRIDTLLRTLGPEPGRHPTDEHDIVSRLLVPDALVYVEDPFGKSDDAYDLSLAGYDFFDFQRLVNLLEQSSTRAGCRLLVTSREPLFERWLTDRAGRKDAVASYPVIRLTADLYYPGLLYRHIVLLVKAKGVEDAEAIADVLSDWAETPYQANLLVQLLPDRAQVGDAERILIGWTGELRTDVESHIAPRKETEVVALLSILAMDAWEYEDPAVTYRRLHQALRLPGKPKKAFDDALRRFSPFLFYGSRIGNKPYGYKPNHSIVREVMREQLAAPQHRPLLHRIALILPQIPAARTAPIFNIPAGQTWTPHQYVAFLLLGLDVALEGEEEAALGKVIFDLASLTQSETWNLMRLWPLLSARLRDRFFDTLRGWIKKDPYSLREAAAYLPRSGMEPVDAWRVLQLLFEEPQRGCLMVMFEESPWAYLFLHLEEAPEAVLAKLDAWAAENPAFFVYALGEGLLLRWESLSDQPERLRLWRSTFFHSQCLEHDQTQKRLTRTIAKHWTNAPHALKELFDFHARSQNPVQRGNVGGQALFYTQGAPDLEYFALEAAEDTEISVRFATFKWGRGDETHHKITDRLLKDASPGFAAAMALEMLDDRGGDPEPWEKETLGKFAQTNTDIMRAAFTYATFDSEVGRVRATQLGFPPSENPFEEPDIVRAAWIWSHINNLRSRPTLTDDELERLLRSFMDSGVRSWCLYYTSYQLTALPKRFESLLEELGATSDEDAKAVSAGAKKRQPANHRTLLSFPLLYMSS